MNKTKKSIVVFTMVSAVTLSGMTMASATQAAEFEWGGGFFQKIWERLSDDDRAEFEEEKEAFMQTRQDRFADRQAHREEMKEVVASGDYAKWKELVESRPRPTDMITEENFDRFQEMHQLMQDGNFEEAQTIREELGMPDRGQGFGEGPGKGMGQGMGKGMSLWK